MKLIDLTQVLSEKTIVYPGKTCFSRKICAHYENGARFDDINLCSGIGTHMDAPIHFDPDGTTIDQIPLLQCSGPICTMHLGNVVKDQIDYAISKEDVLRWESENGMISEGAFVFADTGWGKLWGRPEFAVIDSEERCHFPGFSGEAALLLAERKVNGVGIDTLSIDVGISQDFPAHVTLLKEKVILIENLANLDRLPATGMRTWVLPMKIEGAPEAPVRAFAF